VRIFSNRSLSGQKVVKEEKCRAGDCDVLRRKPGQADRTRSSEIQTWLDRSVGYPVYVVKTSKATGLIKDFADFGLRQTGACGR
jgi:hypothetical protein